MHSYYETLVLQCKTIDVIALYSLPAKDIMSRELQPHAATEMPHDLDLGAGVSKPEAKEGEGER